MSASWAMDMYNMLKNPPPLAIVKSEYDELVKEEDRKNRHLNLRRRLEKVA